MTTLTVKATIENIKAQERFIDSLELKIAQAKEELNALKKEYTLSQVSVSDDAKAVIENIENQIKYSQTIVYKDNHNGSLDFGRGYVLLRKGSEVEVCLIPGGDRFCLNPLYLNDQGKLCLSTFSVGGNVDLTKSSDLNEIAKIYNEISSSEILDIILCA